MVVVVLVAMEVGASMSTDCTSFRWPSGVLNPRILSHAVCGASVFVARRCSCLQLAKIFLEANYVEH